MGGMVLGRHIGSLLIARQLADGFHASSPTVNHLYEVQVAGRLYRYAHLHTVANTQRAL